MKHSHLPEVFQPLFESLQHPLQYVFSTGKHVLSKPDHLLRKLLNTLSSLAMSYGEGDESAIVDDPIYLKIAEITERLAEGAGGKSGLSNLLYRVHIDIIWLR